MGIHLAPPRGAHLNEEQKCHHKANSSIRVFLEWLFE